MHTNTHWHTHHLTISPSDLSHSFRSVVIATQKPHKLWSMKSNERFLRNFPFPFQSSSDSWSGAKPGQSNAMQADDLKIHIKIPLLKVIAIIVLNQKMSSTRCYSNNNPHCLTVEFHPTRVCATKQANKRVISEQQTVSTQVFICALLTWLDNRVDSVISAASLLSFSLDCVELMNELMKWCCLERVELCCR